LRSNSYLGSSAQTVLRYSLAPVELTLRGPVVLVDLDPHRKSYSQGE